MNGAPGYDRFVLISNGPGLCHRESGAGPVNTSRHTGLGYNDLRKEREGGAEALPNPNGKIFAGWIFQAGDLVQVIMVEPIQERFKRVGNVRVIHQPTKFWVAFASDHDFDPKAMAMESTALMSLRQMRQEVG